VFLRRNIKKAYPRILIRWVVQSREGAALRDIINIAKEGTRLSPWCSTPLRVQGVSAPCEIAEGIRYINENTDADVIIVGRGGGSAEDSFAFNDERVVWAYTIPAACNKRSRHETDFYAGGHGRSPARTTLSAAAELAVPFQTT
jgi:exodeoxyribonuclease VII large subunit